MRDEDWDVYKAINKVLIIIWTLIWEFWCWIV
jgi:hypothetical protein